MASNPVTHHEGLEVSTVVEREGGYRDHSVPYSRWSYQLKDVRITVRRSAEFQHLFDLGFSSDLTAKGPDLSICLEREQLTQLRDTIDCIFQLEHDDASLIHGTPERRMLGLRAIGITGSTTNPCGLCEGDGRFDDVECHRCKGTGKAQ